MYVSPLPLPRTRHTTDYRLPASYLVLISLVQTSMPYSTLGSHSSSSTGPKSFRSVAGNRHRYLLHLGRDDVSTRRKQRNRRRGNFLVICRVIPTPPGRVALGVAPSPGLATVPESRDSWPPGGFFGSGNRVVISFAICRIFPTALGRAEYVQNQ